MPGCPVMCDILDTNQWLISKEEHAKLVNAVQEQMQIA
jgi:hypothetical protein